MFQKPPAEEKKRKDIQLEKEGRFRPGKKACKDGFISHLGEGEEVFAKRLGSNGKMLGEVHKRFIVSITWSKNEHPRL